VSEFFSYLGWFQIVLLIITLMSGIFSLVREVVVIKHPERANDTHLFWRCIFVTFIISSVWLWADEHSKLLEEHKRHNVQLEFTFSTLATASRTVDPNSDVIVTVGGSITNAGEMPSIVRNWTLDAEFPDGNHIVPKMMLFSSNINIIGGETTQHTWGNTFNLARDYLPDTALHSPIQSGGAQSGIIMFTAPGVPASVFNSVIVKYKLCYEDINHRTSCANHVALPGIDLPLQPFPGMHR
jgi:hypothetical protein